MSIAPDAVLFDMDGTLVDREVVLAEGLRRLYDRAGAPLRPDELAFTLGRGWREAAEHLRSMDVLGLDGFGLAHAAAAEAKVLVAEGFPIRDLPGAATLVGRLAEAGVKVAVCTGSTRGEAEDALAELGVLTKLGALVTAEDVAHGKPAPDPYVAAIEALGADRRRSVAVEDSEAGIVSAHAAGLKVVAVQASNPPEGSPAHQRLGSADAVVATLDDITDELLAALVR